MHPAQNFNAEIISKECPNNLHIVIDIIHYQTCKIKEIRHYCYVLNIYTNY